VRLRMSSIGNGVGWSLTARQVFDFGRSTLMSHDREQGGPCLWMCFTGTRAVLIENVDVEIFEVTGGKDEVAIPQPFANEAPALRARPVSG